MDFGSLNVTNIPVYQDEDHGRGYASEGKWYGGHFCTFHSILQRN
jgi:hypothetical protein